MRADRQTKRFIFCHSQDGRTFNMLKKTTLKSSNRLEAKSARAETAVQTPQTNGDASSNGRMHSNAEIDAKLKELVHLAQEQGYLTYDDINDALPDEMIGADDLDEHLFQAPRTRRRNRRKAPKRAARKSSREAEEAEEETSRLDILDDPVRMYMNQMGKIPLLTREQEVEICQRIEDAENEATRIIYRFGFAAKNTLRLAEKLLSDPPKERFDRVVVDKKLGFRDAHLRQLVQARQKSSRAR